ncbi:MAG: squalene/phytoene synthase family protein, partial [Verrucomicrobiota bacterium]
NFCYFCLGFKIPFYPAETEIEKATVGLLHRYPISPEHPLELIEGMEMDLQGSTYETFLDLEGYCYRAASVVGLVSIEIFGYQDEAAKRYAVELGHALQLTNIIRDVREDLVKEKRVYLPAEDLEQFGVRKEDLRAERETEAFRSLMRFEAERARTRYEQAEKAFPEADRRTLIASELMRKIYSALLAKMAKDDFRVLQQRYRLSKWEKMGHLFGSLLAR